MLVVDFNTLQTVYLLDFLDDILIHGVKTVYSHDICRTHEALRERLTSCDISAFLDKQTLYSLNGIYLFLAGRFVCDLDLTSLFAVVDADNAVEI